MAHTYTHVHNTYTIHACIHMHTHSHHTTHMPHTHTTHTLTSYHTHMHTHTTHTHTHTHTTPHTHSHHTTHTYHPNMHTTHPNTLHCPTHPANVTAECALWRDTSHSLAHTVAERLSLQSVQRLQLGEEAWSKMAAHFAILLSDQDTKQVGGDMISWPHLLRTAM